MALLSWAYWSFLSRDTELANKREWSILQAVSSDKSEAQQDRPIIILKNAYNSGYDVIGIHVAAGKRVWLLMNAMHAPRIKMMPEETGLRLTPAQFHEIESSVRMDQDMATYLKNAVESN